MKNNLKATSKNNNSSHNKAIFAVLVVVAVLLAAAIGLSFSDLLFPISPTPADSEYAGVSLGGTGTSPTLGACTDTDGGIRPYIQGTVTYNKTNYTDFCWNNGTKVTGSNAVAEFFCTNDKANRTTVFCQNGCLNGACRNATINDTSPGYELDDTEKFYTCYSECIREGKPENFCWGMCIGFASPS